MPYETHGFKFHCKYCLQICSLENWKPTKEGYFVLDHVPTFIETLRIVNLKIPSINAKFLSEIRPPLQGLIVESSNAVKALHVSANSTVEGIKISNSPINCLQFENNTALQKLTIDYSDLNVIAPSLASLSNLKILRLAFAAIELLDLRIFYGMNTLIELNFSSNNIKQLFSSAAASNTTGKRELKNFRLSDNKLAMIDLDLFEPFHMLAMIDISWNKVESISGTLSNPQLQWLCLSQNRITSLSFCTWQGNENSFVLSASYNRLTRVPSCLTKFPNTVEIRLSHNNILHVDMKDFDGLANLREIDLAGNRMLSLAFWEDVLFPKLRTLFLYENCMCRLNGSEHIVERMPRLQILFNQLDEPCTDMCLEGEKVDNKQL
uniref:Leucine rich immune protein (Coil-less) n=1 Tax=Anopheles maculatus TaxID=74869 RepID=A0A182SL67_9DIPT